MYDSLTVLIATRSTPSSGDTCRILGKVGSPSRTIPSASFLYV